MPYDKVKKEDLWGIAADAPAPDEEVEAVEVVVNPDGVINAFENGEGVKFNVDFKQELKINYAEAEQKVMADQAYAEQTKLAGEIQTGINKLLDNEKVAPPQEMFIDMGQGIKPLMNLPNPEPDHRQTEQLVWYPRNADVGAGYDDNTAAVDPIQYTNITDLLARFFIQSHAMWGVIKNWRSNIIGCTSICFQQGIPFGPMHMPMLDYDGKNVKKIVRKDVKALQKDHGLGNAWVYETRRGFHVYFFTDVVTWDQYHEMLEKVQCCKGFKRASINRGYAVLRVSAKYTDFDIKPLYVLESDCTKLRRLPQKAHVIQALIKLGQDCGTHFASMYPQWAHFKQDYKEWRLNGQKKPMAKRVKKVGYNKQEPTGFFTATTSTTTADVTFSNTNNQYIVKTGNGTGNW